MKEHKLCVDARMINSSGIGVYIENIVGRLEGIGLVLLGKPEEISLKFEGLQVIPFDTPIYSVKEQTRYNKLIPKCDLFWSPHYNVPLFPIKARKRVVTIHDVYHLAFFNRLSLPQKIYSKIVINSAICMSDAVITVSDFSKSEIIKYTNCPDAKITRIYNGTAQCSVQTGKNVLVEKYKLPDNYLLFVGNVKAHKNLVKLLQAYLLLNEEIRKQYKLVVVGKKDGFITGDDALFDLINDNNILKDNVVFTGFVADEHLDSIYAHATALIFPSLYEGFGLTLLEAMRNQCPTLASDIPSFREVSGNASLFFDPNNEQNIADNISLILRDKGLRDRLISGGIKRSQTFTWEQAAIEHIKLFEEILAR